MYRRTHHALHTNSSKSQTIPHLHIIMERRCRRPVVQCPLLLSIQILDLTLYRTELIKHVLLCSKDILDYFRTIFSAEVKW